MEMNDKTILRIKVPAHLYESVKAQLTLDEAKGSSKYGAGMTPVKGQKATGDSSDKPKAHKASKPAPPKAEKREVPKDGMKKTEKKERSLDELKLAYEAIGKMIAEMEKVEEAKAPVEKAKEEGKE